MKALRRSNVLVKKWTETEEKELKNYFAPNLSDLRCPNTEELKAAVKLSKSGNGQIHLRTRNVSIGHGCPR